METFDKRKRTLLLQLDQSRNYRVYTYTALRTVWRGLSKEEDTFSWVEPAAEFPPSSQIFWFSPSLPLQQKGCNDIGHSAEPGPSGMMDDGSTCQMLACTAAILQKSLLYECHYVRHCLDKASTEQRRASWLPYSGKMNSCSNGCREGCRESESVL